MRRLIFIAAAALMLCSCAKDAVPGTGISSTPTYADTIPEDEDARESDPSMTVVSFLADGAATTGDGAEVTDNTVKITKGGMYYIEGENPEGTVEIDCTDGVKLVLSDAAIKKISSRSEKAVVTLPAASASTLEEISAEGALTFNGSGTLAVSGEGYAISADSFKMLGGNISCDSHGAALVSAGNIDFDGGLFSAGGGEYAVKSDGAVFVRGATLALEGDCAVCAPSFSVQDGRVRVFARKSAFDSCLVDSLGGTLICESLDKVSGGESRFTSEGGLIILAYNSGGMPDVASKYFSANTDGSAGKSIRVISIDSRTLLSYTARADCTHFVFSDGSTTDGRVSAE